MAAAGVAERPRATFVDDRRVHYIRMHPCGEAVSLCRPDRADRESDAGGGPVNCRECLVTVFLDAAADTVAATAAAGRPDEVTVGTRMSATLRASRAVAERFPAAAAGPAPIFGMVTVTNHGLIPDGWQIRRGGVVVARGVLLDP